MNIESEVIPPPTRKAKLRAATMALVSLMVFVGAWTLVVVTYLAFKSYEQSDQNGEVIAKVEDTNTRLLDCTEPGGECYEAGQKRTAKAVVGINEGTFRLVVAGLSCQADGITETKPLADCMARRAADEKSDPAR